MGIHRSLIGRRFPTEYIALGAASIAAVAAVGYYFMKRKPKP